MASSIFTNRPQKNSGSLIQQFAQFKRQMQGKNPEEMIRQFLADGRMTPQQFEQLKQEAQSLMAILS